MKIDKRRKPDASFIYICQIEELWYQGCFKKTTLLLKIFGEKWVNYNKNYSSVFY